MSKSVRYNRKCQIDLRKLTEQQRAECFEKIESLERGEISGKALQDKNDMDLEGYYSLYFDNAKLRIIYEKKPEGFKIIAIGKRNNFEVHKEALVRIKSKQ